MLALFVLVYSGEQISPFDNPASGYSGARIVQQTSFLPPDLLNLSAQAFEEAWTEAQVILGSPALDPGAIRTLLARRIMAAAGRGERDPARLKHIALGGIEA